MSELNTKANKSKNNNYSMKQLFEGNDIKAMSVTGITSKCVRLFSKENGNNYFMSHADFNLSMSMIPVMFIEVKKQGQNGKEIVFLSRVTKVAPKMKGSGLETIRRGDPMEWINKLAEMENNER